MPFKVGDILKYHHLSAITNPQLDLYHFGKDHLDGKIALVLDLSIADTVNTYDYLCYIDGERMWINEATLREIEENENKKKNS